MYKIANVLDFFRLRHLAGLLRARVLRKDITRVTESGGGTIYLQPKRYDLSRRKS
jgi:hypothetical protein